MFNRSILAAALAVSLYFFFAGGCSRTKRGPEQPEEAVAVAIKLLEAKNYTEFIKRFWSPALLEKRMKELEVDDIDEISNKVLGDSPDLVAMMVRDLNLVKDTKPVLNDKRTDAMFRAKHADGKSVEIGFKLIDGKWCLMSRADKDGRN